MPGHPPPQYFNPLAVAWAAIHPKRPFPECLEIAGCTSDLSADLPRRVDPVVRAERQQRQREAVRRYKYRNAEERRAARAAADALDPARVRERAYQRLYQRRRRALVAAGPAA